MKILKPNSFFIFLTGAVLFLSASCKKDHHQDNPQNPDTDNNLPPGNFKVKVTIPGGSTLDLSDGQILSSSQFVPIGKDGQADIFAQPDELTLVHVLNKDKKLVLSGFVTDTARTITPATTAMVLLHWGLGFPFQSLTTTQNFLRNAGQNPTVKKWLADFEQLFKADPLVVSKGGFMAALNETLGKLNKKEILDVHARKTADLSVDANDMRSGLQVKEDGLSQVSVNNYYRRRAHGFLYKMSYKDLNGASTQVLSSLQPGSKASQELAIGGRSGVTSVMGEVGKWIESTGQSSMVSKSGPIKIELEDNESEALYKLRIVGPGKPSDFYTQDEASRLSDLQMETFIFDLLIPSISVITSVASANDQYNFDEDVNKKMLDILKGQWKSIPDVYEEIKKGNYKVALEKALENIYKDLDGELFKATLQFAADIYKIDAKEAAAGAAAKFGSILSVFDLVLASSDIILLYTDLEMSRSLEEWPVKARSGQVRLTPKEGSAVPGKQSDLKAVIKNLQLDPETYPYYEWSTSGKYGYINDLSGHSGSSFESQKETVRYYCQNSGSLQDGQTAEEYIYVKAYYKNQLIGTDTVVINISTLSYKMTPKGITLTGKEGGHNEVALRLVRPDNVSNIGKTSGHDYKIVWTTEGKYGNLSSRGAEGQQTITTYNDDKMNYQCTNDEVKEAQENITARIYFKTAGDDDYFLLDEVQGLVNIDNDAKKRIVEIPVTYYRESFITDPKLGYGTNAISPTVMIPVDDDAIRYKVMIYNETGTNPFPKEGSVYSWAATQNPPLYWMPHDMAATHGISGGVIYLTIGTTGCSFVPSGGCGVDRLDQYEARYKELYGPSLMAEITYYY